jgi:predicted  nucleic acid-binding Zn-ribbon protein
LQNLLQLQKLDTNIAEHKAREQELPRQKDRFDIQKKRLAEELKISEERCVTIQLQQREIGREIEQRQAQIEKYEGHLAGVKKNEEYKAVLHEIELFKKQIGVREERIIALMLEFDDADASLQADRERIQKELDKIEKECETIDTELHEYIEERKVLEQSRPPMAAKVSGELLSRYERIRKVRKPAVVPLLDESCGGCFMAVRPQIVNEILADSKIHACQHCGRLLYEPSNIPEPDVVEIVEGK